MVAMTAVHSRIMGTRQRALIFTREELLDTSPMLKQAREEGQEAGRPFGRPAVLSSLRDEVVSCLRRSEPVVLTGPFRSPNGAK